MLPGFAARGAGGRVSGGRPAEVAVGVGEAAERGGAAEVSPGGVKGFPRTGEARPDPLTGALRGYAGSASGGQVAASLRVRWAVYLLLCGLVPWAGVKTVWTLGGDVLGVNGEDWLRGVESDGDAVYQALAAVGIDLTVLAALLGVFLALGLVHRWGMVFPRWTLFLAGRRVPAFLPLVPAWGVGLCLGGYGVVLLVLVPLSLAGVIARFAPPAPFTSSGDVTWMILFGGLAFGGLGGALLVGAWSYGRRVSAAKRAAARTGRRLERPGR